MKNIEELKVLKSILNEEEYSNFVSTVSGDQNMITRIKTTPIDNYPSSLITDNESLELLRYIYQNIRYYLLKKGNYRPKLEEGIAILVSKSVLLKKMKNGDINSYFNLGEHSYQGNLVNPFEEIARLLLNASKREYFELGNINDNVFIASSRKIELEQKAIDEILALSLSKTGIQSLTQNYCYEDFVTLVEQVLENSNINSKDIKSATTKSNKGVILDAIDKTIDLYHTKLDYISLIYVIPSATTIEVEKTRFENKTIYAKRNIGVYEKTKRLVKEGHH